MGISSLSSLPPAQYFWQAVSAVRTPSFIFHCRRKRNADLPSCNRPAMPSHLSSTSVRRHQCSWIHSSVFLSCHSAAKLNSTLRIHAAGTGRRSAGLPGGGGRRGGGGVSHWSSWLLWIFTNKPSDYNPFKTCIRVQSQILGQREREGIVTLSKGLYSYNKLLTGSETPL